MTTICGTPLAAGLTEVWSIDLRLVVPGPLPADDHLLAARFQDSADAERWKAGRWALRRVLGRHLGLAPEAVPLVRGRCGKPEVAGGPSFNMSATADDAVIAVRGSGGMGIDLQAAAVGPEDLRTVADGPLAPAGTTDPQARWARLEAVLKCLGRGLGQPVPATVVAALGTGEGRLRIDGRTVWWRDLPHHRGRLCVAADAPFGRIVGYAAPGRPGGWDQRLATPLGIEVSDPR